MKKVISVTKRDIENGCAGESTNCPLALAIRRGFKRVTCVEVNNTYANVFINTTKDSLKSLHALLPSSTSHFIKVFDMSNKGEPFKVTLDFK